MRRSGSIKGMWRMCLCNWAFVFQTNERRRSAVRSGGEARRRRRWRKIPLSPAPLVMKRKFLLNTGAQQNRDRRPEPDRHTSTVGHSNQHPLFTCTGELAEIASLAPKRLRLNGEMERFEICGGSEAKPCGIPSVESGMVQRRRSS